MSSASAAAGRFERRNIVFLLQSIYTLLASVPSLVLSLAEASCARVSAAAARRNLGLPPTDRGRRTAARRALDSLFFAARSSPSHALTLLVFFRAASLFLSRTELR
jgi:hypothetical protein